MVLMFLRADYASRISFLAKIKSKRHSLELDHTHKRQQHCCRYIILCIVCSWCDATMAIVTIVPYVFCRTKCVCVCVCAIMPFTQFVEFLIMYLGKMFTIYIFLGEKVIDWFFGCFILGLCIQTAICVWCMRISISIYIVYIRLATSVAWMICV